MLLVNTSRVALFGGLIIKKIQVLKKGGAKDGFFLGRNSTIGKNILEQAF